MVRDRTWPPTQKPRNEFIVPLGEVQDAMHIQAPTSDSFEPFPMERRQPVMETVSINSDTLVSISEGPAHERVTTWKCVRWCFTLNNYTAHDTKCVRNFAKKHCKFMVYGLEVGAEGTPHLQGYLELLQKHDIGWVTARLTDRKAAHVEPCKASPEANIAYCEKADDEPPPYLRKKPVDRIWRWGEPEKQGQRNDLAATIMAHHNINTLMDGDIND